MIEEGAVCPTCGAEDDICDDCGCCPNHCTCVECRNCGRLAESVCENCGRCDECDHEDDCDRSDWYDEVDGELD
jgi:hypothetical protein